MRPDFFSRIPRNKIISENPSFAKKMFLTHSKSEGRIVHHVYTAREKKVLLHQQY